jgi:hypothetical protein
MIDQPWQKRLDEGMVRAYLVEDQVVGFGHQAVNALHSATPDGELPTPGPRLYTGPDDERFQELRRSLEHRWVQELCQVVGVSRGQLPLLWDADFLLGERATDQPERYVLCEINVSSVAPFPDTAVGPLVNVVRARLHG